MLAATFLATFMIPMFYVVVADKLSRQKRVPAPASPAAAAVGTDSGGD
jgi:multidrug efflux pump